ncbi:chitobiase/beta-hexosaminidase C-terminal domain-containing protein [uncultured Treponema sp.]|uniref:chitobiase/beta-hexosaminidase C-terminal domain-containing protein n=1 Tax=uncultured Treponema sp. TaxID=162155 RepID=UPI0025E49E99|nr:chitobiase/beta-hexosaminidase C-terminal domain-containing protein [uncultured Treponema sp.]
MTMIKKFFRISAEIIAVCFTLNFSSCIASIDSHEDSYSESKNEQLYGSLTITTGASQNRALDMDAITAADVTVTGYGIVSTIKKENVSISQGSSGGAVKIEGIPVGKNRVVTVQAKTTIDSALQGMAGVTMTAVCDIQAGDSNSVTVNWENSKVGNVYAELLKLGYDVSNLSVETVKSYLPANTHAALIDAEKIASEIRAGTASADKAETYKLSAGTLTFESNATSSSIILQICDPVSSKLEEITSGTNTISNVAPGTWKVFGIVNGTTVVYANSVTITSGEATNLGSIKFQTPAPRLENASGAQISEFISSATTVYLKARTLDGEDEPEGVAIYYTTDGTVPSTSSTLYNAANGITVTAGVTVKAIAVCSGLLNSEISSWKFAQPSLGYTHPATGDYSPVDMNGTTDGFGWASGTWALGAHVDGENTTFALYSANATKILLEIYGSAYGTEAMYDYWMVKGSDNVWRAKLSGDLTGAIYAFRCWGPNWDFSSDWKRGGSSEGFVADYDASGNRFNPNKVVYDPYAREMTHDVSNAAAIAAYKTTNTTYELAKPEYAILSSGQPVGSTKKWREYDSGTIAPKGYIISDAPYSGTKPGIPASQARIYEAHVRGITQHPSSSNLSSILNGIDGFENVSDVPAQYRGTYKGAAYMAPYLKALGINTIELLPVHETDNDANPDDSAGGNYWGYMTFGYFAPDRRYSYDKTAGGPTREFKEMVDAFHNEGIEVYLDVVYNHSGEGGTWHGNATKWENGVEVPVPDYDAGKQCTVVSMRGIDNQTYYSLVSDKKWSYWETTGCGNNLQCDNSVVRQFILDSLTYWIQDMGVDGFRFDLAPVLGREGNGTWNFSSTATTLTQIASLGASNSVEMIAEAWDCQWPGGYKIGKFPDGWGDWNGVYRDVVRKYVGGAGTTETKADYDNVLYSLNIGNALYGSSDVFGTYRPSVNMIDAHDGFTLADLSSYAGAGNACNGNAWPFGPSDGGNGDTNYIPINTQTGHRQINRNYIALQMVTRGIPMIVWGDEFGRTQNGNNNPYNIDSVATWNNYNMINTDSPQAISTGGEGTYNNVFGTFDNEAGINGNFLFMKRMLKMHSDPAFTQSSYSSPDLTYQDGGDSSDATFGYKIEGSAIEGGHDFFFFSNMTSGEVSVTIPAPATGYHWVRICDTGSWAEPYMNSWDPFDTDAEKYYEITTSKTYGVGAWTVLILQQVKDGGETPTCATPVISGTTSFDTSADITITCSTDGADIYYTTDGTIPTTSSTLYTGSFTITSTTTVKAIAVKTGYNNSGVESTKFTHKVPTCANPVFSGDTTFTTSTTVSINCDTAGATIRYTLDGTVPTESSDAYTAPFTLTETKTVKAKAFKDGLEASEVVSQKYTLRTQSVKSGLMLQGFNWNSAPRGNYGQYTLENPSPLWGRWYDIVKDRAGDIKETFAYMWCPPPSKTDTNSSEGYAPTELNDLNNCYGTAEDLSDMISAISPTKAIADIVVNHRAGTTCWGDFTNPDWGVVKSSNYKAICSDDEGFNSSTGDPHMYGVSSDMRGAADTGDGYGAYRDLDHTNTVVQQGIIDWMNNVLKPAGFVGWRYDYVKGYAGKYVGKYNAESSAEFSVGEYWPTAGYDAGSPSTWGNAIKNWIASTENEGGQRARAFDFALKGAMNTVFGFYSTNERKEGNNTYYYQANTAGTWNFGLLADSSNLYISQPADAVTFVDNHDTGSNQGHWGLNNDSLGVAYALILTHPGVPCVAWNHYFTFAESGSLSSTYPYSGMLSDNTYYASNTVAGTSNSLRQHIDKLIQLRKDMGIEYDSIRTTVDASNGYYVAEIKGTNGNLLVMIGSGWSKTSSYSGYEEYYSGTNFKIWVNDGKLHCANPVITFNAGNCTITCATTGADIMYKIGSGSYQAYSAPFTVSEGQTVYAYASADGYEDSSEVSKTLHSTRTLSVTVPDWIWNDSAVIFAWVWGDTSTGEWITVSGSGTTATIAVPDDTNGFNMARCPAGTSAPSWTATGNSAGRIYNKTEDVTVSAENNSYSTSWVEFNP